MKSRGWKIALALWLLGRSFTPGVSWAESTAAAPDADPPDAQAPQVDEVLTVTGRRPVTATSTMTVPAESFEILPLESGGQMLEVVPNLITAQHTGGGKAEQYFIRGFDADHGTDLAVYFDGVPINLRSHAHGQGFLDLHFVTKETIERLDAYKGPYFARYGDFATAAVVEYVPFDALEESFAKVEGGYWETFRAVAGYAASGGPFGVDGPATGYASFEAYHTNGPFDDDEDLWRYSGLVRGSVELGPELRLSGHLLGYHGNWHASGLIPETLVEDDALSRWGSLDPSEGGRSTRAQGKLQLDWSPTPNGALWANVYVAYYDLELFSNFTYFLENDDALGDGIVQKDEDRVYTGGRVEYTHFLDSFGQVRLRAGVETRYDDVDVLLGTQTRRDLTGCERSGFEDESTACADNRVQTLSVEPYVSAEVFPLDWIEIDLGLRYAWFHFDGRDRVTGHDLKSSNDSIWLPKANLVLSPFSAAGVWPSGIQALYDLQLYGNFGIGYHSNDARAVFADSDQTALPRALGGEVGFRTSFFDRVELAVDWWILQLDDEFVFVGDEGTTESAGESIRQGIEAVAAVHVTDWLYLRGDVAYTSARLVAEDRPVPQAPRFIAKGAVGVRWQGLAAELAVRHLGERYASEAFYEPRLSGYTVLDLAARYRWRFIEVGIAVENLTDTAWRSSEFHYESRPIEGGDASEGFHFTPGNPRNVRGWVAVRF